jgi:hypothetical protein
LTFLPSFLQKESLKSREQPENQKAAHLSGPGVNFSAKTHEKLPATGRSPVHIYIQQHMAMLRAEAGLVNNCCMNTAMLHVACSIRQYFSQAGLLWRKILSEQLYGG